MEATHCTCSTGSGRTSPVPVAVGANVSTRTRPNFGPNECHTCIIRICLWVCSRGPLGIREYCKRFFCEVCLERERHFLNAQMWCLQNLQTVLIWKEWLPYVESVLAVVISQSRTQSINAGWINYMSMQCSWILYMKFSCDCIVFYKRSFCYEILFSALVFGTVRCSWLRLCHLYDLISADNLLMCNHWITLLCSS